MPFLRNFFRRLSRALDALDHIQIDERSLVGDQGEQHVARIVADCVSKHGGTWLRGPLLFPTRPGCPEGEKDFLVYTEGNLFCIEVKRWRGIFSYREGLGEAELQREKRGNYGETIFMPPKKNPLPGTRWFIAALKEQTAHSEKRFSGLKIIPVVAFDRIQDTNISAIRSFQKGIIYAEDLPQFFAWHRHPQFAQRPSKWITHTIQHSIPSWDWIITTRNEMVGGILTKRQLLFKDREGKMQNLSFSCIHSIRWKRENFSSYDEMTVLFTDGTTPQVFYSISGEINIQRYESFYTFKMSNIQELIAGISNKNPYTSYK
jgi:hypothetical protein